MKKALLILVLIFFINPFIFGQSVEVSGGVNRNSFFVYKNLDDHYCYDYYSGYGYSFGLGINEFKLSTIPLSISINFTKYSGNVKETHFGLISQGNSDVDISKYCLGTRIYPFKINLIPDKLKFNIGVDFSFYIYDKLKGYQNKTFQGISTLTVIENGNKNLQNKFYFGAIGNLSYEVALKNLWYIKPQLIIYLGFSNEFHQLFSNQKSLKNFFEISIGKRLH